MKHAGERALNALADLLGQLREIDGLKEKKRGIFYLKSAPFLHFHEDPAGLFADLRVKDEWNRFPLNSPAHRNKLIAAAVAVAAVRTAKR